MKSCLHQRALTAGIYDYPVALFNWAIHLFYHSRREYVRSEVLYEQMLDTCRTSKIRQYGPFYTSVWKTGHHNVEVMGILN